MIQKETILSRFISKYGNPVQSNKGPFFVGSKNQSVGMTTDIQSCLIVMLSKFKKEHSRYPSLVDALPIEFLKQQEIKFDTDEGILFWFSESLIDLFHILDMRPFTRVSVKWCPTDIFPLFATRDGITLISAPNVLPHPKQDTSNFEPKIKKPKQDVWRTGMYQPKYIKQLLDTTFWLIEVEDNPRMVKCKNCRAELLEQDWLKRYIVDKHPQCLCSCNTYDDWCGCQKIRLQREVEKQARSLRFAKRAWTYGS